MKKFVAMMLALVMVLALVACGGSATPANTKDSAVKQVIKEAQGLTLEELCKKAIDESNGATCAPGIVRCCPENRISLRILCISWYHARSFLSSAAQNVRTCNETEGREKWFSSSKKNVFVRFKEKTLAILTGLYYNTPKRRYDGIGRRSGLKIRFVNAGP